ncbi:B12-binding domain-containing radical SAM protein [Spirosoma foliorum]|uniref:Radical SAM protein n=1 Tax=Spirosoma foliorum TaxID=2710596 RepID=A0A7G5H309_9BACT|nr:radical SAM protein [Spirosoma foliorum]QMW05501.1 radical SAM protein [Spirosoma foliorum]
MTTRVLLLTPPFTQLNTPYPATAYLKGYLNTLALADGGSVVAHQADLGIETIVRLFSTQGLSEVFSAASTVADLSENSQRMLRLQADYVATIGPTIRFLQHRNPTLAHAIADRSYLPEASRFAEVDELDWAFGTMGLHDKARHLATLYLEDIGDLVAEAIDPHFGFSRYAERLGRTATHFDDLHAALTAPDTLVGKTLLELLEAKIAQYQPTVVCLTVPFPGNLFGALLCGRHLKQHYPTVRVVLGGGYANTELRSLREPRLFDYVDFVSLDDGEAPLRSLLEHIQGKREAAKLKRTFMRVNGEVVYQNGSSDRDVAQRDTGTPDYADLPLNDYLSVIEVTNPMHRLWSDGRWNKLTLAHGCYWGKCSFCDISLDYIARYEPLTAGLLCDRIETIMAQTGQNGFHFVDEAAPPALMRDLALEILRRGLTVVWWTNIRFEKAFTTDLCQLLKLSGCIAVSGGLEVASDRLLDRMKKGVTVAQVARVANHFTTAGIMVHAYLMYGFPTQTAQETIDSLEMVRQLFAIGVVQSGFWHRFAMTAHSPVGLHPAGFDVQRIGPTDGPFADNDLEHADPLGADHARFSEGLRKSLFNYMHGVGLELPLANWFTFRVPTTTIPRKYIERAIADTSEDSVRTHALLVWPGHAPTLTVVQPRRGRQASQRVSVVPQAELTFARRQDDLVLDLPAPIGEWLMHNWPKFSLKAPEPITIQQVGTTFEQAGLGNFSAFQQTDGWADWRAAGLLVL